MIIHDLTNFCLIYFIKEIVVGLCSFNLLILVVSEATSSRTSISVSSTMDSTSY